MKDYEKIIAATEIKVKILELGELQDRCEYIRDEQEKLISKYDKLIMELEKELRKLGLNEEEL